MDQTVLAAHLERFQRLHLIPHPTPLEKLNRLSQVLGREIHIKRDDTTSFALGGNKVRKLEYLAAAALAENADTLITAGAIQSNHVRQTAALAARLGMDCLALLENPIDSTAANYLSNGNRLLLDLFGTTVENVPNLDNADQLLAEAAAHLKAQGKHPFVVPIGGSNALGALGYVRAGLELAAQIKQSGQTFAAVIVASGSAGTHSGLALGLEYALPGTRLVGVTVSRPDASQRPKVENLLHRTAELLEVPVPAALQIELWDNYFAPRYGEPNAAALASIQLLASHEGILLDPVYTGKAFAGLIDGIEREAFSNGPVLFVHTGGSPALFAYH